MQGSEDKLTTRQEHAIAALLAEPTLSAAAERAAVSEVTLYRWLKQKPFRAHYREARRELLEKATAQLQASSWAAATTLLKLLGSGSDSVKLRAAQAILDHANKGVEIMDFQDRLEAVEQIARDMGEPRSSR